MQGEGGGEEGEEPRGGIELRADVTALQVVVHRGETVVHQTGQLVHLHLSAEKVIFTMCKEDIIKLKAHIVEDIIKIKAHILHDFKQNKHVRKNKARTAQLHQIKPYPNVLMTKLNKPNLIHEVFNIEVFQIKFS